MCACECEYKCVCDCVMGVSRSVCVYVCKCVWLDLSVWHVSLRVWMSAVCVSLCESCVSVLCVFVSMCVHHAVRRGAPMLACAPTLIHVVGNRCIPEILGEFELCSRNEKKLVLVREGNTLQPSKRDKMDYISLTSKHFWPSPPQGTSHGPHPPSHLCLV